MGKKTTGRMVLLTAVILSASNIKITAASTGDIIRATAGFDRIAAGVEGGSGRGGEKKRSGRSVTGGAGDYR